MVAAVLSLAGCSGVPGIFVVEKSGTVAQNGAFNARDYVAKNWSSKVIPTLEGKAVEATTVLEAIRADPAAASKKYGTRPGGEGTYAFVVKGTGVVTSVEQAGAVGQLAVDVTPPDGKPDLNIAVGPVFLGTALRDAVGFIKFGQFTNQIEYASVAAALNSEVRTNVTAALDFSQVKGKTVGFTGAFQLLDPQNVVVTPVQLKVKP